MSTRRLCIVLYNDSFNCTLYIVQPAEMYTLTLGLILYNLMCLEFLKPTTN